MQAPPPPTRYSSKPEQAAAPASASWQRELLALLGSTRSHGLGLDKVIRKGLLILKVKSFYCFQKQENTKHMKKLIYISLEQAIKEIFSSSPQSLSYLSNVTDFETSGS